MSHAAVRPTLDPIPGLIRRIAIPAGTGMLFHTLFNVIDTWYAGLISTQALAALAVSFPVYFLVIALVVGIGQGASALIANALGADDPDQARRLFGQALTLSLGAGALVAVYGLFASDPLFRLMGSVGESLSLARTYLVPILAFAFIFLANAVLNGLLSAMGDTRPYRDALIGGACLNVLFNPLFMYGLGPLPGLGLLGIAIATIVIQFLEFAYLWHRCRATPIAAALTLRDLRPNLEDGSALLRQTLPVTGQMLATGVGLFTITAFMGRHGEAAVAAYGIGLRIEQLAMLPMIGLSTAALTLTGQNAGGGKPERVGVVMRISLIYGVALMTAGAVLVWLLRQPLMAVFAGDADVIRLGSAYLAIAVLNFNAYAILMIGAGILQGWKRPVIPMAIGLFRHVFGLVCLLWLFESWLGYGLPGIYWGIFSVSWLGALITLMCLRAARA